VIHLSSERCVLSLSAAAPPAARVPDGGRVELDTADCFAGQIHAGGGTPESIDWGRINPATGPVYVEGAEPGDALSVFVERIEVAAQGLMAVSSSFGVLRERVDGLRFAVVPLQDGIARLPGGASVPVQPMIGVLGVAPRGEAVPCGSPGPHGGNMDTRLLGQGATLHLPVFVPGALLAAGDLHAAMGDGEVCGTGVEVAGRVVLRLAVRRDLRLSNPLLETADVLATIASAETLDEAADRATADMADLLISRLGLSLADSTMLMSAAGHLQVCQVVDPLKTARFSLAKAVVEQLGSRLL